jgi:hypothetical protein
MNPEANLIRFIIRKIVGGKDNGIKDFLKCHLINWERFKELIIYHDLTPFAYLILKDFNSFLPEGLREFLKNNYYCALVRCQKLWQEFLRIYEVFSQAGVCLLPIKGIALLEDLYKNKYLRPMTDIDLLVKEEDLPKAEEIFCDLGYRKELYGLKEEYWRKKQCHISFYKREDRKAPFVELHWSLDFKRGSRNILPELWSRIREINVDGMLIKLLSPEDTLFSLALHSRRLGRTLCLKNVYDAILLLNKHALHFDWDYVLDESKRGKMCTTIFFLLSQVKFLLNADIPEMVWKKLNIPFWKKKLIHQFIERNTYVDSSSSKGKNLYLKSHFLLYDNLWEPIEYILNIPKEQFAKYYNLNAYDKKTDFLYRYRLIYIPFKAIFNLYKLWY